jgi:predicted TIM-barrel fold metal-dependent hydrolase
MHIIDPDRYPLSAEALYTPQTYTLDQALAFEASAGLSNIVIVQPSIYGNDNSCLLNALRALGPRRGRGVIAFDPATTGLETLREWHTLGVRAVRINIQSIGKSPSRDELQQTLQVYADAVRPLGWVIQVYVPLPLVETLEPVISTLGVRFCIDHMGHPCLTAPSQEKSQLKLQANPYDAPGFAALIRLLEAGHTFVKLSAPYRISKVEDQTDIEPFAREILRVAGKDRVVFATDWPHTRYEGLDITPWIEKVLEWCCGDAVLVDRVFRRNAEDLWDARA